MNSRLLFSKNAWIPIALIAVVGGLGATYKRWVPYARQLVASNQTGDDTQDAHSGHGHSHPHPHPHGQGQPEEIDALQLSELARKNIGLKTGVVQLQTYVKTVSVPAMVVERTGRSQVEITAPLTGVVTRVHPIEGEAIQPGQRLFDLRLTHEDLVSAQREFLKSAEELDVVEREIDRLESVGEGVIAGRRIVEQQYEQQKIEAGMRAQKQGLLLHGLSNEQIEAITETRQLLQSLTVVAPPFSVDAEHHDVNHLYHVQRINVNRGQHVMAGDSLSVLADHCLLFVEGQAFEDDANRLVQAARDGWLLDVYPVTRVKFDDNDLKLKVLFVADHVDSDSRALSFYLKLPNTLVRDEEQGGHRFVAWQYRPGQRMEVRVPLGQPWEDQVVLPPEAVVDDGAESYVFEQHGDHFDRVPIHVVYRDQNSVVVDNDGSLIGNTLAMSGAYEMHLAIKNKSGGGVDPHAGHNH